MWASPGPLMAQIQQKVRGRENYLLLLELGHPSSPALGHQISLFSSLQTLTELHYHLSWFSNVGGRLRDFSVSIILIINPLLHTYKYPVSLFLWRTLTDTVTSLTVPHLAPLFFDLFIQQYL